jgi:hypothetical protein
MWYDRGKSTALCGTEAITQPFRTDMAKKTSSKTKRPKQSSGDSNSEGKNAPVSKQTAGGVTGAVLGGVVAGPLGAIAGGLTGAMVGEASARGRKPMKTAVDAIRSEIRDGNIKDAVKSVADRVTTRIKSLRKGKKTKRAATKKKSMPAPMAAAKKSKTKPAKKKVKTSKKKAASTTKKKRAKKKR